MNAAGSSEDARWGVGSLKGSARRIQNELKDIRSTPSSNSSAGPKGDNLYEWVATLMGPPNTPYSSGVFFLSIDFPADYPFTPPTITFRTRIYHCNINADGKVCLDLLDASWSPALTIATLLAALNTLLEHPNPHDPLVGSIAVQYLTDRNLHDTTARDWTSRFAT